MKKIIGIIFIVSLSMLSGLIGGIISNEMFADVLISYLNQNQVNNNINHNNFDKNTGDIVIKYYIEENAVIDAVKKAKNAVVSIVATKDFINILEDPYYFFRFDPNFNFDNFFEDFNPTINPPNITKKKVGGGSGFIFDKRGYILTNKHVVYDKNAQYTVTIYDGRSYEATIIGVDPLNDAAVLKINVETGADLPVIEIGQSKDLQIGQTVIAIGYALAQYDNTVTTGVISAKGRQISAMGNNKIETLSNLLQTDAAINPGNSGGPLINLNGQVIGVNVAIDASANGIGFAIPIDELMPIIRSVIKTGKVSRPFIGIRYIVINKQIAEKENLKYDYGVLIPNEKLSNGYSNVIPGSPADKAGIKPGNIILEVNGEKIKDTSLQSLISKYNIGDTIQLKIYDQETDKEKIINLTLEEYK